MPGWVVPLATGGGHPSRLVALWNAPGLHQQLNFFPGEPGSTPGQLAKLFYQMEDRKIPATLKKVLGHEHEYNHKGKMICRGILVDVRWSVAFIMNLKTGKKYRGVQYKIKPVDGYGNNRAFWTTTFSSGIQIKSS